jgi:hypothetical protein
MMKFRYIRESEIPSASDRNGERCAVVKRFLNSEKEALEIEFDSVEEARNFARYVQTNKSKVTTKVKAMQRSNFVYLRKNKEVE